MIFGVEVGLTVLIALGIGALALLVFQMLVGTRRIHFKGKTHSLVHRRGAWALLVVASVHGFLAFLYATGLTIG